MPNSREGARGMAGTGGPGYQIDCEINQQKHQAGTWPWPMRSQHRRLAVLHLP